MSIGSVVSTDGLHWVGNPAPGGHCLVSYSQEGGAVLAWEYNFAYIMNQIRVPQQGGSYKDQTVTALLHERSFSMLESSGDTGNLIASEIKHQLGMKEADQFAYKIVRAPEYGDDHYMIYISDSQSLRMNAVKNQSNAGSISVTGYVYRIGTDGASTLVKQGTRQTLSVYTNGKGQEKIDINGNQDNCATIPNKAANVPYNWEL